MAKGIFHLCSVRIFSCWGHAECASVVDALERALRKSADGMDAAKLYDALGNIFIVNFSRNSAIIQHVDNQALIEQLRPMLIKAIIEHGSLALAKVLGPFLEVFVAYFGSGILSLYNQWLKRDSELPLGYLSDLAMATVAGGVSALVKAADELHIGEFKRG